MKLFFLPLLLFLVACTTTSPINLNPPEFKDLISDESVFVIDVHIPEQEHIPGTDAVIPYNEIEKYVSELPKNKRTKIAIYCRSGSMSAESSQTLVSMGYKNVYNLEGGRNAYVAEFGEMASS